MENNKTSSSFSLNSEKGYVAAIFIALIIVASIAVGYYFLNPPAHEGYNTIYLLDSNNKAIDYPELAVANKNSTFNVQFVVENHMAQNESCQVLLKITKTTSLFPVDAPVSGTYEKSLEDGETWHDSATVSINQVGNYSVVFELWLYNQVDGVFEFSNNFCVLNIQVIAA